MRLEAEVGGLEVVPSPFWNDQPGLEVLPNQPYINPKHKDLETKKQGKPTRRNKTCFIVTGGVACLVVLGAVLGGVLPKVLPNKGDSAATASLAPTYVVSLVFHSC
jgi:hypothetical protein